MQAIKYHACYLFQDDLSSNTRKSILNADMIPWMIMMTPWTSAGDRPPTGGSYRKFTLIKVPVKAGRHLYM